MNNIMQGNKNWEQMAADCSPTWQDVVVRLANDSDWPQWEALFREYRISQSLGTGTAVGFVQTW